MTKMFQIVAWDSFNLIVVYKSLIRNDIKNQESHGLEINMSEYSRYIDDIFVTKQTTFSTLQNRTCCCFLLQRNAFLQLISILAVPQKQYETFTFLKSTFI